MKSELEKHPALLGSITQYWEARHMGDSEMAHYMIGMSLAAHLLGEPELGDEIDMLEAVFSFKAWHADELAQEAA